MAGGQNGDGRYLCCNADRNEDCSSSNGRSGASKMSPLPDRVRVDAGLLRGRAFADLCAAADNAFVMTLAMGAIVFKQCEVLEGEGMDFA